MGSQDSQLWWMLAKLLAASCILPSVLMSSLGAGLKLSGRRRRVGWICTWAGQSGALVVLSGWVAVSLAATWVRHGAVVAGLLYGLGGLVISGGTAVTAIRTFGSGVVTLRGRNPSALVQRQIWRGGIAVLALDTVLFRLFAVVDIPGRWNELAYSVLVLVPVGGACVTLLLASVGLGKLGPEASNQW